MGWDGVFFLLWIYGIALHEIPPICFALRCAFSAKSIRSRPGDVTRNDPTFVEMILRSYVNPCLAWDSSAMNALLSIIYCFAELSP